MPRICCFRSMPCSFGRRRYFTRRGPCRKRDFSLQAGSGRLQGMTGAGFDIAQEGGEVVLRAAGGWLIATAAELDPALSQLDRLTGITALRIDMGKVAALDTVGAWLALRTCRAFEHRGARATIENVPDAYAPLLDQVLRREPAEIPHHPPKGFAETIIDGLAHVGVRSIEFVIAGRNLLGFLGLVSVTYIRIWGRPGSVRWVALATQIVKTGVS